MGNEFGDAPRREEDTGADHTSDHEEDRIRERKLSFEFVPGVCPDDHRVWFRIHAPYLEFLFMALCRWSLTIALNESNRRLESINASPAQGFL